MSNKTVPPPTVVGKKKKKKKGAKGKCSMHARYEGKTPPKCACPVCWGMYLQGKYDMSIEEVLAPEVVHLNDPVDVQRFIAGLKSALDRSKANGGSYSAFAHDAADRTFQVDVQLRLK